MKTMNKKYRSVKYNQAKLKVLSDSLCDDIDNLLTYLDIEYKQNGKMLTMPCPIHGGDNRSALNLYPNGDSYRGNWKCRTHNCEETFKSSVIGFVRGVLSHKNYGWSKEGDPSCTFAEAIDFVQKFVNQNLSDIKISKKSVEKNKFINTVKQISTDSNCSTQKISRNQIIRNLKIPSPYFLDRGFSSEILTKYDVGECYIESKEMFNRAVVPIYDKDYKFMVGCSGRSIFQKCGTCGTYHGDTLCPNENSLWKFSKWKHNQDFKTQENLYNFWFAKEFIKKTRSAILVESPGNVWRLEEAGIHNSVAIFGSSLADRQKLLLDMSGAMSLILMMDNDEAGDKACQQISKKCQKIYNIHKISIDYDDIGSMTIEQIQNNILPKLNELHI
jgi:5S rRNA maturation endonuclease (ribonuclease M5)